MDYFHVDVFSSAPMKGNGLTVVFPKQPVSDAEMLQITREFKQFETIFIGGIDESGAFPVRIFTVDEELQFAGHPILGAAAVVHNRFYAAQKEIEIHFNLSGRRVKIESVCTDFGYQVVMNQGAPTFIARVDKAYYQAIAQALSLSPDMIDTALPVEVVSTGLPYLLVPLVNGLCDAKIAIKDFEGFLAGFGAKFVYVFDAQTLECRTWDNLGLTEDVATGSAAGPLCAYLVKNGLKNAGEIIRLKQGRYTGRPSILEGWVSGSDGTAEVFIRGDVSFFASGSIRL